MIINQSLFKLNEKDAARKMNEMIMVRRRTSRTKGKKRREEKRRQANHEVADEMLSRHDEK